MQIGHWGRAMIAGSLLLVMTLLDPVSVAAVSDGDYDAFDSVTLNDLDGLGLEVAYAGAARRFESQLFTTATFTMQPGEADPAQPLNGCLRQDGSVAYAGRTGWVRFNPGVNGRINVVAETPAYDAVLMVRTATERSWRSAAVADLQGPHSCADSTSGPAAESVIGFPVTADRVYYAQVGGVCSGGPTTCADSSTPGGATRIVVEFTPFDADGDGVPDSLDDCEGTGTPVGVAADGCPDSDGDGIADPEDACPALAGPVAAAPYNGCPPGYVPPASTAYVTIRSLDDDKSPYNTSKRKVELVLSWPLGTTKALISNKNSTSTTKAVANVVTWRLHRARGPAVREVRVRFRGPGVPDVVVGDSILLDPTKPELAESVLVPAGEGWYVGLLTEDSGSGISGIALLNESEEEIKAEVACVEDEQCETDFDIGISTSFAKPAFVEITDLAGNRRVTALNETSAAYFSCPPAEQWVMRVEPGHAYKCLRLQQRCGRLRPLLVWDSQNVVRCRRAGVYYRVVPLRPDPAIG